MSIFRRASERRGTAADYLIVGLGNPGDWYSGTRHNLGSEVVENMAARSNLSLRRSRNERAFVASGTLEKKQIVLACPETFMNLSGESVRLLVKRYGIDQPAKIIVAHDELDLNPGRLKLKSGGSTAGHNGLKSIVQHLGEDDFVRVRMGVGKPPSSGAGKDWVLKKPSKSDRAAFDDSVQLASDALESIIRDGLEEAMQMFNRR